jgi:broad specificity phosphatase PhoE
MELLIIRHGESHFNTKETSNLNSPLTSLGRDQCYTCGAFLRRKFGDSISEWKGIVSPFLRTVQTADILNRYTECGFTVDWQIREFAHSNSGYSGAQTLEIPSYRDRFPEFYPEGEPPKYIQHMESEESLVSRVSEFLAELEDEDGKYIVVSHGLTIYTMIYVMNGNPQVPIWDRKVLNTSVTYFNDNKMVYFARFVNGGRDPRGDAFEYMML